METMGAYLREMRREAGITQERLAEQIGFSQQYVSLVERDRYTPSWDYLIAFARAVGAGVVGVLRRAGLIPEAVDEDELAALVAANPNFAAVFEYARARPDIMPDLVRYARFLIHEKGDGDEPSSRTPGENSTRDY